MIRHHRRSKHKEDEILSALKLINKKLNKMAKTLADLEGQVDRIQTKLDAEQEQIKQALDDLKAANQELKDQIAQGQIDVASIERISGKLDTLESDLESTIADEPEEEEPTE